MAALAYSASTPGFHVPVAMDAAEIGQKHLTWTRLMALAGSELRKLGWSRADLLQFAEDMNIGDGDGEDID